MDRDGPAPFDLLVFGESASGIAAAVQAARRGLRTLLVTAHEQLGGVLASLGAIETHYDGVRSVILEELRERILEHYRTVYGVDSVQYHHCIGSDRADAMLTFEPTVVLRVFREMVEAEATLEVLHRQVPIGVERRGRLIRAVRFASLDGGGETLVRAETYVDASYVGDLAATAGASYRLGRESRQEHDEPHAGVLFTRWIDGAFPLDAVEGRLKLHAKRTTMGILAGSSGEGDREVQDYSYRLCLSRADGSLRPERPPGYRRDDYAAIALAPEETLGRPYALHHRFLTRTLADMVAEDHIFHGHRLPNDKRSWNATNFTGAGKGYAEGSLETRREIESRHLDHALGILYFLQNDEAVPADIRNQARAWGLAADEFVDNGHVPYHLYVREARRFVGRFTFTEHDALLESRSQRTPCHGDSIAITDFPLDSLSCTTDRRPGTTCDGQFFLQEQTRPAQVPYRVMVPVSLDNLLVSVCVSATHVAWGTLRQTPTLVQLGEVAACAAACASRSGRTVSELDTDQLQRDLVRSGHMISFFNDFDMATGAPWVAAVQYLGTKGFFPTYDAHPDRPLGEDGVHRWQRRAVELGWDPATIEELRVTTPTGTAALALFTAL